MPTEFRATKLVTGKYGKEIYDSMSSKDKKAIDWLAQQLLKAYGPKKRKRNRAYEKDKRIAKA